MLTRLIDQAVKRRPRRFDRKPSAYGFSKNQLPSWCTLHTGDYRRGVQEGRGAALLAWLRAWVQPVLAELARADAAKSILLKSLPPAPKEVNQNSGFHPPAAKVAEWEHQFDGPAVHLWSLWYRWQDITCLGGEEADSLALSPPPRYPGLSHLPRRLGLSDLIIHTAGLMRVRHVPAKNPHARAFLRSVTKALEPTSDLAVNAEHWTGLLCDALHWLRGAIPQPKVALGSSRRRRGRRPPLEPKTRPLTEKQTEAVYIVGECKGSLAEAARRLGIDRKSLAERYEAANKKLGVKAVQRLAKPQTQGIPEDERGQSVLASRNNGPLPGKPPRRKPLYDTRQ